MAIVTMSKILKMKAIHNELALVGRGFELL